MIKRLFFVSALMISAALAFVACSSDDDNNDNQGSLVKTTWVLEEKDQDVPMTISIVSDQEGYICSSFKTTAGDGKEYKFETRTKFTYQKEGEKYKMVIKSIAAKFEGNWDTKDIDGADFPLYFTVNEQAKTLALTYENNEKITLKKADYAPITWSGSAPHFDEAETKDDVLGEWVGGIEFPYPMIMGYCDIFITKVNDVYSASGRQYSVDKTRDRVLYDVSFTGCSYTVKDRKVYIENVGDDTKIVIETVRNMGGFAGVVKGGKIVWLPCVVFHIRK